MSGGTYPETFEPSKSGSYYLDITHVDLNDIWLGGYSFFFKSYTDDFGGSQSTASQLNSPTLNQPITITGNTEVNGDTDMFAIKLTAGTEYKLETTIDSQHYFRLLDEAGKEIGIIYSSVHTLKITATYSGNYYIEAYGEDFVNQKTYTAKISISNPLLINGTAKDDVLTGGSSDDTLNGFQGNDNLSGMDGNDVLNGGVGNDTLYGGQGDDKINGGQGKDTMSGGTGKDTYVVDDKQDVIVETSTLAVEIDTVTSTVNYTLPVNVEDLVLKGDATHGTGNALANHITSNNTKHTTLNGGLGDDTLYGGAKNDTLIGGAGGDYLLGSDGNDKLNGGIGNDSLYGDNGSDQLNGATGADWLYGGAGNDVLNGGVDIDSLEGGNGNDKLNGEEGNDYLNGDSGNDILMGGAGNDQLDGWFRTIYSFEARGAEGEDTLSGGLGNDSYYVDNIGDVVIETSILPNEIDSVWSSVNYLLPANVENLQLEYGASIGRGNKLDNSLSGYWGGNSRLLGYAGNDNLQTQYGNNLLVGGLGKDQYFLDTVVGRDTVRIHQGESLTNSFDIVNNFGKGDRLDLDSNKIAANAASANGNDIGILHSHHISQGIISFDDLDTYAAPLKITDSQVADAIEYLQANISNTVAFIAGNDTYVFQDGGTQNTLVKLVGVIADGIHNTAVSGSIQLI